MITQAYILSSLFLLSFIYQLQKIDINYLQIMIDGSVVVLLLA